jgi:hypothetical protein
VHIIVKEFEDEIKFEFWPCFGTFFLSKSHSFFFIYVKMMQKVLKY